MPLNYWQDKWVKDQFNRTDKDEPASPPPPAATCTLPTVPANKDEYIRMLEEALVEAWKAISDKHMTGEVTRRAFLKLDQRMRGLGLLP